MRPSCLKRQRSQCIIHQGVGNRVNLTLGPETYSYDMGSKDCCHLVLSQAPMPSRAATRPLPKPTRMVPLALPTLMMQLLLSSRLMHAPLNPKKERTLQLSFLVWNSQVS